MPKRKAGNAPGPEDTQEMFTAGQDPIGDPDETREYEAAAVDEEPEPLTEPAAEADEEEVDSIEDEPWEEDEYEEWEDDPEFEESETGSRADELKAALTALGVRARGSGATTLKKIGDIKLPRHQVDGQKAMIVGGIVIVALLVGAGGYVVGKGSGDDLDQARLEGEFAGRQAGAVDGATKGYAAGFKKGRDVAFRKSYTASYRRNYVRAYENAGMDAPKPVNIEVPRP